MKHLQVEEWLLPQGVEWVHLLEEEALLLVEACLLDEVWLEEVELELELELEVEQGHQKAHNQLNQWSSQPKK